MTQEQRILVTTLRTLAKRQYSRATPEAMRSAADMIEALTGALERVYARMADMYMVLQYDSDALQEGKDWKPCLQNGGKQDGNIAGEDTQAGDPDADGGRAGAGDHQDDRAGEWLCVRRWAGAAGMPKIGRPRKKTAE